MIPVEEQEEYKALDINYSADTVIWGGEQSFINVNRLYIINQFIKVKNLNI